MVKKLDYCEGNRLSRKKEKCKTDWRLSGLRQERVREERVRKIPNRDGTSYVKDDPGGYQMYEE